MLDLETFPKLQPPTGRQVADYSGGLDFLDEILQKVYLGFVSMKILFIQLVISTTFYFHPYLAR